MIPINAYAISSSFNTSISAVYPGMDDFGMNMFPLTTRFMFYSYPQILPEDYSEAYVRLRMNFDFGNSYDYGYDYNTGTPLWILKRSDAAVNEYDRFGYNTYFIGSGEFDLNIEQGFFTNPVAGEGNLMEIALGFCSYYFEAHEPLAAHKGLNETTFIDPEGNYYDKFKPGSKLQAYPWLEGNRKNLVNYIYSYVEFILDKSLGWGVTDGFYIDTGIYYGPWWLANNIDDNITSDFFSFYFTFQEKMALYHKEQPNGFNWLSMQLVHYNTLSYTNGDIVPRNMLPSDRLNWNLRDRLYLNINGPQFISWDCYTDIDIGFTHNLSWGNIVNEKTQSTTAIELNSSLDMLFHLRLFGFMHFEYGASYTIARGIYPRDPGWYHSAEISFYITV